LKRVGMLDRFGESGTPLELFEHFNLTGPQIAEQFKEWIKDTPRYHQGF